MDSKASITVYDDTQTCLFAIHPPWSLYSNTTILFFNALWIPLQKIWFTKTEGNEESNKVIFEDYSSPCSLYLLDPRVAFQDIISRNDSGLMLQRKESMSSGFYPI